MTAVVAGWIAGYAMALLTTGALTYLLVQASRSGRLERWIDSGVEPALLAVPVSIAAVLGWTMIGLVFGSFWLAGNFDTRAGALGTPSWQFTLIIAAVALLPLPPLLAFARRYWWLWAAMSALFLGLFGWLMPLMAVR